MISALSKDVKVTNMEQNKTILTVNGKQYSVQAPPGWVLGPADIEQAKQNILSGRVHKLNPATCPDVIQGTSHDVTLTASGGTPNYTYTLLLDGVVKASAGPISSTSYTFSVVFGESVGSHILRGEIVDSCTTIQTAFDQCTSFNILAPPTLNSITISGCGSTILSGATCTLTAACLDQYSAPITCGTLTWISTNTSVAAVSSSGVVTGIAPGSAGITARNSTGTVISNSIPVTVSASCPAITSCSITTCPPANIMQGTPTSLTVSWSGGTSGYTVQLLRDGVDYGSPAAVSSTSATMNFTVDTSWTVTSHTVSVKITDSCSTQQVCTTSSCTVNVTAACASLGIAINIS